MPSNAYLNFLHIRIDVLKLIEVHSNYTKNQRGRKNLGFLTRSAVIMLCAAWERYNEDLLIESISYTSKHIDDINLLDKKIKQTISSKVKLDKNEIKVIELAGLGWKKVWLDYAKLETEMLNTPKSEKLNTLFKKYLGIDNYLNLWKCTSKEIDDFVSDRGSIAHNGNKAQYITMNKLRKYQDLIIENVIEIDSKIANELKKMTMQLNEPWKIEYYKDLEKYK
jgi:hypothetical protein